MTVAPKSIRSRVINFVACASGTEVDLGQVSRGTINPDAGETAATVWNKPVVQIPIQRGCTNVLFNRPFGAPLPSRIIRYATGGDPVVSKFHYDARSMSAALGLTFFEGWDTSVGKLVSDFDQRVMGYWGRPFPIFDTTLTPWSWIKNINDPAFQSCPGALMRQMAYSRYQIAPFLDNGGAEFHFDATALDRDVTSGRYDTSRPMSDWLTAAGDHTHADFTGTFSNDHARVFGFESLPLRSTTAWAANKTGCTWLANSGNAGDQGFDVFFGNNLLLQPDEMDVWPIVFIRESDLQAYTRAIHILTTYSNLRVCVKFLAMLNNGFDMAALLAAGAVVEDDEDGDGDADVIVSDTCGAIGFAHSGCEGTVGVAKECCTTDDDDDDDDNDTDEGLTPEQTPSVPMGFGLAPTYMMIVGDPTNPDGTWDGSVDGPFGGNGGTTPGIDTPSSIAVEPPIETPAEPDPDLTPFDDYIAFIGDGPHPDGGFGPPPGSPIVIDISIESSGPNNGLSPTITS